MERYKTYKDSGLEWIGDIPEKWKTVKIKFITDIYTGNSLNSDLKILFESENENDLPYVSTKDVDIDNNTLNYENGLRIPLDNSYYKVAPKGSFLMCIEGANAGKKMAYVEQDCCFVNKLACFNFSNKFLFYYLQSHPFKTQFFNSISGLIGGVSISVLKEFVSTIPSPKEQTQIAVYLDYKTSLIDTIIKQKEELIKKLKEQRQAIINEAVTKGLNPDAKLKDSGIDWLGEIPEHWEVTKLKFICNAFGRIGYRGYTTADIVDKGNGAITISPSNIKQNKMDFDSSTYISWEKYEESPEIQIFNDDILMVKTGSTYGKVGIVKNLQEKATINPQLLVFKTLKINPDFLFEVLRMPLIQSQVETGVIGSTIPTISQTKILDFQIAIPSHKKEIEDIAIFIKKRNIEIDSLNHKLANSIQKLKEYRQSLISEAVTGKIDVRDWQLPKS